MLRDVQARVVRSVLIAVLVRPVQVAHLVLPVPTVLRVTVVPVGPQVLMDHQTSSKKLWVHAVRMVHRVPMVCLVSLETMVLQVQPDVQVSLLYMKFNSVKVNIISF